jgi:hypothetical protein
MPKDSISINAFEGGLNLRDDPRDIGGEANNQLSQAIGVDLQYKGRIVNAVSGQASSGTCGTLGTAAGYGLHSFSADYDASGNPNDTDYYLVGSTGGTVDAVTSAFGAASALDLSIGSGDTGNHYAFFVADGGVRVSDGNYANTNAANKVAMVKYVQNPCIGGNIGSNGAWVASDSSLSPPQSVQLSGSTLDTAPENQRPEIFFTAAGADDSAVGWGKDPDADTNGGDCSAAGDAQHSTIEWEVGCSFVYDEDQETTVTKSFVYSSGAGDYTYIYSASAASATPHIDDSIRFSTRQAFKVGMAIKTNTGDSLSNNSGYQRITKVKGYMRKKQAGSSWFLIIEADLSATGGVRNPFDDDYNAWDATGMTDGYFGRTNAKKQPPQAVTFRSETGYDADSGITYEARFKTAAAINRRAYIGNIYQNGEKFGDRLLKTGPNQFDIYPEGNWIDVVINDGDFITTMVVYADRIFQFKRRNLYLLNVAEDTEFLEGQYLNYGVMYPSQVCVCSFGVLWVNEHGCYRYDGESVIDLTAEKIPVSDWAITETSGLGSVPGISYSEKLRKLFICPDLSNTSSAFDGTGGWSFDMVNEGWTQLPTGFFATGKKSNFHIDFDGDICYVVGSSLYKVGTTPGAQTDYDVRTKDLDFGATGVIKKIYKTYITYKCSADSNVTVAYAVDADDNSWTDITSELLSTGGEWDTVALTSKTSAYTYRIRLYDNGSTVPADFEVNDISVTYRTRPAK